MPDTSDKNADQNVQLPWESFVDDDAPAEPAQASDAEGDAEMYARALARVEEDAELDEPFDAAADAEAVADLDAAAQVVADAEPVAAVVAVDPADAVSYESPVPAEPLIDDLGPAPAGGGWTLTMLCVGIALIACCLLIPQADSNRRLAYERERLKVDLESLKKQVATNDEFLKRVADDPNLAERLAQRQMKIIRQGTRVLELKKTPGGNAPTPDDMSPFHLVHVAPPPPMPPYQPNGGRLANICYDPHKRLYLLGAGLFLMAAGLVMGFGPKDSTTIR